MAGFGLSLHLRRDGDERQGRGAVYFAAPGINEKHAGQSVPRLLILQRLLFRQ